MAGNGLDLLRSAPRLGKSARRRLPQTVRLALRRQAGSQDRVRNELPEPFYTERLAPIRLRESPRGAVSLNPVRVADFCG
jgi:hypothetical protein